MPRTLEQADLHADRNWERSRSKESVSYSNSFIERVIFTFNFKMKWDNSQLIDLYKHPNKQHNTLLETAVSIGSDKEEFEKKKLRYLI